MDESRRYISGAAKPGVYMGRMKLPSLLSTSRAAPKSISTARLSSVMKILAGLMSRCSILCWCTMRKPAQDFVKQRADGRFAEHLVLFQVARRDDEVLQGRALQVVHHHVDGFVLAEEVQHAHHRAVRNLGQRAAFFKKTLEAQTVERQFFRLHLRQQLAGAHGWPARTAGTP